MVDIQVSTAANAHRRIQEWGTDFRIGARDLFKFEADPWQDDFLAAAGQPESRQIAAKACKGPGKTCVLAIGMWLFAVTRPHVKIAATSISKDNLADCLWTELATWQNKSDFLKQAFKWTRTRIESKEHYETWWMSARGWSQTADTDRQADTLAGLHGKHLLFVLDEVGGIPNAVMAAAEAGLSTGGDTHLWISGNPTKTEGPLYRAFTDEADQWHKINITGDPDNPERSPRIDVEWARAQIRKYGADNPWVLTNVFGEFPPSSINALLGPEDVQRAIDRHLRETDYNFAAKILGIDAARFGDDPWVLVVRQGLASWKPRVMRNPRTEDVAGVAAQIILDEKIDATMVDGTGGYGVGCIDALNLLGHKVFEVQAAGDADDPHFYNKRAEMHWRMAEWIKGGASIHNTDAYRRELPAPTYTYKGDRLIVEPKEQIKDRIGESPNHADALGLTHAFHVAPKIKPLSEMDRAVRRAQGSQPYVANDYEPLA